MGNTGDSYSSLLSPKPGSLRRVKTVQTYIKIVRGEIKGKTQNTGNQNKSYHTAEGRKIEEQRKHLTEINDDNLGETAGVL